VTGLRNKLAEIRTLIISADGALHRLPWCVLKRRERKYLLEELTIAYVPSARSLVERRTNTDQPHEGGWLAVGGVDYGVGDRFASLPGAAPEAKMVDELFRQFLSAKQQNESISLLSGREATKEKVLQLLPTCRFVHIATHGDFFQNDNDAFSVHDATGALDSSLAFAGANDDLTKGINSLLTAEEIHHLDLSDVDLMVLSACDTGLGHIRAGQGLIGLPGAIDRSGVGTLVSALWKVDDRSTAVLMERFYRALLPNIRALPTAAALREAQLNMLQQADGAFAHPYFWAAWTVTGNGGS
jgi:CHAT domain-containing protein